MSSQEINQNQTNQNNVNTGQNTSASGFFVNNNQNADQPQQPQPNLNQPATTPKNTSANPGTNVQPAPQSSQQTAPQPTASKTPVQKTSQPVKAKKIFSISGVSMNEKVFLAKHMATIIKSGISLPESLRIMENQSKGTLKKILGNIVVEVESGQSLHIALSVYEKYFDPLFINMVKIGEKSGSLEKCLGYLAKQLEKDAKLIAKVRTAALYPSIVLITAVGVGGGISYFILPKLAKLFTVFQADLPFATRILVGLSKSLEQHGLYWLVGIIASIILYFILRRNRFIKTQMSRVVLYLPIFGKLSKSLNLARFSLTLGTLLKSGVNITEALGITQEAMSSLPYKKVLMQVQQYVNSGKTIAESIIAIDPKEKLFPGTVKAMITVGEKTGSLHKSLIYISEFYEEEVDTITKNLATSLEPILLVIIGIIVAFVAIAIVSPMYQLLGSISR